MTFPLGSTRTLTTTTRMLRSAYRAGAFHLLASYVFVQGLSYVAQLTLATFISPAQFGIIRNVEAALSITVILGSAGMPTLAVKLFAQTDDSLHGALLRRLLAIASFVALGASAIAFFVRSLFLGAAAVPYYGALVWVTILVAVSRTCLNYFQGVKQFQRVSVVSTGLSLLSLASILVGAALIGLNGWLFGRYLGEALFVVGALLAVRHVLRNHQHLPMQFAKLRLVSRGAAIASSLLVRTLLDSIGILLLGVWGSSVVEVGLFGLSNLIVTIALIVPATISNIAVPRFVERADRPEAARQLHVRTLKLSGLAAFLSTLFLIVASPLLTMVVGSAYLGSVILLQILALSLVPRAIVSVAAIPLLAYDRMRLSVLINLGSLGLCVLGCVFAIPAYGAVGAAWCIVATEFLSAACYFGVSWCLIISERQTNDGP